MLNLTLAFERMDLLRAVIERAERARAIAETRRKKYEARLEAEAKKVKDVCRPALLKAIEEYNKSHIAIDAESISIYIDGKEGVLSLFVQMRFKNGSVPDEEFDERDHAQMRSALAELVDTCLNEASLPFRFGELRFPSSYFMK